MFSVRLANPALEATTRKPFGLLAGEYILVAKHIGSLVNQSEPALSTS